VASWLWPAFVGIAAAGGGIAAALAGWRAARPLPRTLVWDGAAWSVREADGTVLAGTPRVMMDLGAFMLLRFDRAEPTRERRRLWLPLSRRSAPAAWHGLRAVLHAGGGDT
jgi:hypothetical protein